MDIKVPHNLFLPIEESDYLYQKVLQMMDEEGNGSMSLQPFDVVNLYAKKYKSKTYKYDMDNQYAMFLKTTPQRLSDELVNGVHMQPYEIGGNTYEGALLTSYFNYAACDMHAHAKNGQFFVPVATVAMGNMHVCETWDDFNFAAPIPKACDSLWTFGVYGHTVISYLEFSNQLYKIHLSPYQVTKRRLAPINNSQFIVHNRNQVEIIMLIELKIREIASKRELAFLKKEQLKKEEQHGVKQEPSY